MTNETKTRKRRLKFNAVVDGVMAHTKIPRRWRDCLDRNLQPLGVTQAACIRKLVHDFIISRGWATAQELENWRLGKE